MTRGQSGWLLPVILLALVGGTAAVMFLLFNWADGHSPWFLRTLIVLLVTSIGFRLGREVGGSRAGRPGPNWSAIGVAMLAAGLALYFGVVRPAARDRERDEAFTELLADGRVASDALAAAARDTPDADAGRPVTEELREQHLAAVKQGLAWLERYKAEMERFTPDQRRELHDEFARLTDSNALAREKLARFKVKSKKE